MLRACWHFLSHRRGATPWFSRMGRGFFLPISTDFLKIFQACFTQICDVEETDEVLNSTRGPQSFGGGPNDFAFLRCLCLSPPVDQFHFVGKSLCWKTSPGNCLMCLGLEYGTLGLLYLDDLSPLEIRNLEPLPKALLSTAT